MRPRAVAAPYWSTVFKGTSGAGNALREFGSLTGSTAWAGVRAVVGSWQAQARSHCRWAFPARTKKSRLEKWHLHMCDLDKCILPVPQTRLSSRPPCSPPSVDAFWRPSRRVSARQPRPTKRNSERPSPLLPAASSPYPPSKVFLDPPPNTHAQECGHSMRRWRLAASPAGSAARSSKQGFAKTKLKRSCRHSALAPLPDASFSNVLI